MCPIETLVPYQLGPGGFDALGLAAILVLYALRVVQQAQALRSAAAAGA